MTKRVSKGGPAIAAIGLAILGASALSAAEIAPGYVDKIVQAYGGEAALDKMASYRVRAETVALRRGGVRGTVVREVRAPDAMRVRIVYPDATEVRVLDGERGWRGTDGELAPVSGVLHLSMVYQMLRADLPGVLVRNRERLLDGGVVQGEDGAGYRIFELPWSEALTVRYWIEARTLRVLRVEGTIRAGEASIGFATEYGDFREVDGAWFPFREVNLASGVHVADTVVIGVEWGLPDGEPRGPG